MKKSITLLVLSLLIFACANSKTNQKDAQKHYLQPKEVAGNVNFSKENENYDYTPNEYGLPDFTKAAAKAVDAVVYIKSEVQTRSRYYRDYYDMLEDFLYGGGQSRPSYAVASGSGVIISPDGYIVTNNHVVQDASKIEITLNDRRNYIAKVVGLAPSADLALLKIEEKNLPYLQFANSDKTKIGEWVLAVGNPYELNSTVTAGIVSAKARNINIMSSNMKYERPIESFIQTDAAINAGNSGGALINLRGDLVGINTAIASQNGGFIGYGFAIPANIAKKITEDLRCCGEIQSAYLGIGYAEMTAEIAKATHNTTTKGLYIGQINQNGSAYAAGLREKDIILEIENIPINTSSELVQVLAQFRPGDTICVSFQRGDELKNIEVQLQDRNGSTKKKG
ncbi:MAG: trypsin-like peptidase domain-containing protein [Bacteroidales bacterium]|jgi:Do/DeqQ family serine protease|nr:trypsin-like peptidase domain-containing protein [Bacteroidales bacterium]